MAEHHNFPPEPEPRRRTPAGRAIAAILVAFLVGSLFNADRMDHTARTQPFGWQRTWAMRVTGPIKGLGDLTRLSSTRESLAEATGHETQGGSADTGSVLTVPASAPEATTTTTAPPVYRTPTAADPVRILVVGDSLMGWIGPGLDEGLDDDLVDITEDWKAATGLARPDSFDWPARVVEDMAEHDPEVVVIGFGGNDAQPMRTPNGNVRLGTPEWAAEYQRRVAQILQEVDAPNRTVYWIGLPVTTAGDIEDAAPAMREAVMNETDARPWAHFVDSRDTLSPDGTYTAYLPDGNGGEVKVRENDGVHPNIAGARRIAAPLIPEIVEERHLA